MNQYYRAMIKFSKNDKILYFYVKSVKNSYNDNIEYAYFLSSRDEKEYDCGKTFFKKDELKKLKWHIMNTLNYEPFQKRYSKQKLEFIIENYSFDSKSKIEIIFPEYTESKVIKHTNQEDELDVETMMKNCLEWYPNCFWQVNVCFMRDAGNEMSPYYFVLFGKKRGGCTEPKVWETAYIDKNGKCFFPSDTFQIKKDDEEYFECAYYEYESSIKSIIKYIYEEIKKRRKE